jgi:hypothetical protein
MARTERKKEMLETAESFRWLLKDKLVSMDNVTRAMISEMRTLCVSTELIAEYLPEYFQELANEVVREQTEKYDKKGRPA